MAPVYSEIRVYSRYLESSWNPFCSSILGQNEQFYSWESYFLGRGNWLFVDTADHSDAVSRSNCSNLLDSRENPAKINANSPLNRCARKVPEDASNDIRSTIVIVNNSTYTCAQGRKHTSIFDWSIKIILHRIDSHIKWPCFGIMRPGINSIVASHSHTGIPGISWWVPWATNLPVV